MADNEHDDEQPPVRVTDKRRLNPETGEPREAPAAPPGDAIDAELDDLLSGPVIDAEAEQTTNELAERTEDLRRLKAEYDNYRRRVDRDKAAWGEVAIAKVMNDLLPALDDIARAKAHDALDGAFKAVADQIEKATASTGLKSFGETGEVFDPSRHEALTTVPSDVSNEQVLEVYRAGYEFGGRVLRAAQVVVAVPNN